jgi:hypothetical protein
MTDVADATDVVVDLTDAGTITRQAERIHALENLLREARYLHLHDVWAVHQGVHGVARYRGWCEEYEETVSGWNENLVVPMPSIGASEPIQPEPQRDWVQDLDQPFPPPPHMEERTYDWVERYVIDLRRSTTLTVPVSMSDGEAVDGALEFGAADVPMLLRPATRTMTTHTGYYGISQGPVRR